MKGGTPSRPVRDGDIGNGVLVSMSTPEVRYSKREPAVAGLMLSAVQSMWTPKYPTLRSAHQDRPGRSKGEVDDSESGGRNSVSGMSEMWLQEILETLHLKVNDQNEKRIGFRVNDEESC